MFFNVNAQQQVEQKDKLIWQKAESYFVYISKGMNGTRFVLSNRSIRDSS